MSGKLTVEKARGKIIAVGIFYIISGVWEYLLGLTQAEAVPSGKYFLLDAYRNYAIYLGLVTILAGISIFIGVLFKLRTIRFLVLILAWWNLFTAPIIETWWCIYAVSIKKFLITTSWLDLWVESFVVILMSAGIHLYIINILKVYRAGYLFLRGKQ